LTEVQEDHYNLESEVGDRKLQRVDAKIARSQAQKGLIYEECNFKLNLYRKRKSMPDQLGLGRIE